MAAALRRLPVGALGACLLVGLIHVVVSGWVVPHPVARESLRRKVIALTEHDRPSLLIAGDSRAERTLMPEVIAAHVGMPPSSVVNIAFRSCDSSATLAAYREFSGRFATAPIMLISVSLFSVNDTANTHPYIRDEILWAIGLVDRMRLVSMKEAVKTSFLAERELLYQYLVGRPRVPCSDPVPERGFLGKTEVGCVNTTSEWFERTRSTVLVYPTPVIDGIRWRQLEADLQSLIQAGAQVVVLDAPEHPAFLQAIAGTAMGAATAAFHRQLGDLCERMRVPILRYGPDWLGARDPDTLFWDALHLNCQGAAVFSEMVGPDLNALVQSGRLRRPQGAKIKIRNARAGR